MNIKKFKKNEIDQLYKTYESTIKFEKFIAKYRGWNSAKNVLDVGCGIGSNLYYFSKKNNNINFFGGDYRLKNINYANKILLKRNFKNIKFFHFDLLNYKSNLINKFQGITCIHTFCTFKHSEKPIKKLCKLGAKWIGINSLFYDGPLEAWVRIRDFKKQLKDNDPDADFNIFSIPKIKKQFRRYGYKIFYQPYFPTKTIPRPKDRARGSYTISTEINKKTIFSGPIYLPWYFVIAKKIT